MADMQRRHFELIASTLAVHFNSTRGEEQGIVLAIISDFADKLARTNPNFDKARFIYACKARPE